MHFLRGLRVTLINAYCGAGSGDGQEAVAECQVLFSHATHLTVVLDVRAPWLKFIIRYLCRT